MFNYYLILWFFPLSKRTYSFAEFLAVSTTEEVETHTPSLVDRPKSMNMLAEDVEHTDNSFIPTPIPPSELTGTGVKSSKMVLDEPKGRALNFSMDERHVGNNLSNVTARHLGHDDIDLSDVTIGDEDEDMEMLTSKILSPKLESKNSTIGKQMKIFCFYLNYYGKDLKK